MKRQTITLDFSIYGSAGTIKKTREVKAWCEGGLGIHKDSDGKAFHITHVQSGFALLCGLRNFEMSKQALAELLTSKVDFTRSLEDLKTDLEFQKLVTVERKYKRLSLGITY